MPYFELKKGATQFPPAHFADIDGLVAVGGDIDADILLKAYNSGLYYWHHPMKHIKWWSPDPRIVLQLPTDIPKPDLTTDRPTLKVMPSEDTETLLRHLQSIMNIKEEMNSQWLSERMYRIFSELQQRNYLKLFAIVEEGELIGGLFGIAIGSIFFGEYIWAPDKEAMVLGINALVNYCNKNGIKLIDMQKPTFQSPYVPCDEMSRLSYVDYCKMNAITNHP